MDVSVRLLGLGFPQVLALLLDHDAVGVCLCCRMAKTRILLGGCLCVRFLASSNARGCSHLDALLRIVLDRFVEHGSFKPFVGGCTGPLLGAGNCIDDVDGKQDHEDDSLACFLDLSGT